jgi:PAS domain S-box-containing protein
MQETLHNLLEIIVKDTNSSMGIILNSNAIESRMICSYYSFNINNDIEKKIFDILTNNNTSGSTSKKISFIIGKKKLKNNYYYKITSQNTLESYSLYLFSIAGSKKTIKDDKIKPLIRLLTRFLQEMYSQSLIKKSAERFRTIFDNVEDFIFVLNSKGNFIYVNDSGTLALEFIPDEIIGNHFLQLIDDVDKVNVAKSFQELLKSNKLIIFEAKFKTKYGKSVIFEINARSTFANDKIESVIGIGRNITERRNFQNKLSDLNNKLIEANRLIAIERDRAKQKISVLEELNRLKNEFVSNISHELRTPLASIIGYSETIDSDPDLHETMRNEFNGIILTEAKKLAKLINDVLDISKIEGDKIDINKIEFNVIDTLNKVIEILKKKAGEKNISLSTELYSSQVFIFADEERIKQVFENIIGNAIKFTYAGGRIAVLVQALYKEIEIIISDTGIGIPQKDLPFIFQKFYRVSRKGNEIPGAGLGLSFVKQIIDLHKGLITVKSKENEGTTFIIKLPKI